MRVQGWSVVQWVSTIVIGAGLPPGDRDPTAATTKLLVFLPRATARPGCVCSGRARRRPPKASTAGCETSQFCIRVADASTRGRRTRPVFAPTVASTRRRIGNTRIRRSLHSSADIARRGRRDLAGPSLPAAPHEAERQRRRQRAAPSAATQPQPSRAAPRTPPVVVAGSPVMMTSPPLAAPPRVASATRRIDHRPCRDSDVDRLTVDVERSATRSTICVFTVHAAPNRAITQIFRRAGSPRSPPRIAPGAGGPGLRRAPARGSHRRVIRFWLLLQARSGFQSVSPATLMVQ